MDIYAFLRTHVIPFERYDHEAVFTCEQADILPIPGDAAKTKNLFLRDRKGRRHFLVTVCAEKTVDIKELEGLLKVKGLSFASSERLMDYLGLEAGAVTILGVINDTRSLVEVIVDEDLWNCKAMQCHPLVNTSTLVMNRVDVERFLSLTGHEPRILPIPVRG